MGSLLFLCAWGVLMGPWTYGKESLITTSQVANADHGLVQHLVSGPRLPFTAAYFGSIALTLYFSLSVGHGNCSPLSLLSASLSHIPGAHGSFLSAPHASLIDMGRGCAAMDPMLRVCLLTPVHLTTASRLHPDLHCDHCPVGVPRLLHRLLLSHGLHGPALRRAIRRQPRRCLDDGLMEERPLHRCLAPLLPLLRGWVWERLEVKTRPRLPGAKHEQYAMRRASRLRLRLLVVAIAFSSEQTQADTLDQGPKRAAYMHIHSSQSHHCIYTRTRTPGHAMQRSRCARAVLRARALAPLALSTCRPVDQLIYQCRSPSLLCPAPVSLTLS